MVVKRYFMAVADCFFGHFRRECTESVLDFGF
jgi:hypothetical protein